MSEFIDALQKSKGANELNILRNVIDKSAMEKARTVGQLGETRTWGGKEYIKTAKGWRPKPKGGSKEGSGALEEKKVPGAPKNFHFVGASDEGWPKGSSNIHHALDVMGGSKYSDPSKVSLDYDDKYGWSVSYDGKEVGSLSKNAISKEDAKAAGWYKEGQDSAKGDAKESANDKSQKESSGSDWKKMSDEEFNEKYFGKTDAKYKEAEKAFKKVESEFKSKWGDEVSSYVGKIESLEDLDKLRSDAKALHDAAHKMLEESPMDASTVSSYKRRFSSAARRGKTPDDVLSRFGAVSRVHEIAEETKDVYLDAMALVDGVKEDLKRDSAGDLFNKNNLCFNTRRNLENRGEGLSRRAANKLNALIKEHRDKNE